MLFHEWLQGEMEKRGLDQAELARRAELTSGTVSNVLNGNRQAGPDFCIAIARALGLPREEVFRARGWLLSSGTSASDDPALLELVTELDELPGSVRESVISHWRDSLRVVAVARIPQTRSETENTKAALRASNEMNRLGTVKEKMAYLRALARADREVFNILEGWSREKDESTASLDWAGLRQELDALGA